MVLRSGRIHGKTTEANLLIDVLQLNDESYRRRRRLMIEILAAVAKTNPALHRELLGFPDDLPDLAQLKPPSGNSRPLGIKQSHYALRQTGKLADTY